MPISLEKQSERVVLSLEKREVRQPPTARCGLAIDLSGSMEGNFRNGNVQNIVFRLLAIANVFDDNSEMDMWGFNTSVVQLEGATPDNFETYVQKEILDAGHFGGGTAYAPCLKAISEFYYPENDSSSKKSSAKTGFFGKLFGKSETTEVMTQAKPDPAFVMFLTDGLSDSTDIMRVNKILTEAQSKDIYWVLVGVGTSESFSNLKRLADAYPNVGFVSFESLEIDDEELYDSVIGQEFLDWTSK